MNVLIASLIGGGVGAIFAIVLVLFLGRRGQKDHHDERPVEQEPQPTSVTDTALAEYRTHLINAGQKAQEDFDKTVLSLSGGALGISFAFVKDVIGEDPIRISSLLFSAWIFWGLSVTSVLLSYYTSNLALRKTIEQVDEGKIYDERPGKCFDVITAVLNLLGAILFFAGVILITIFVALNLGLN
jgi:hypothetical protein